MHGPLAVAGGNVPGRQILVGVQPGIGEARFGQQLHAPVREQQPQYRFQRRRDGVVGEPLRGEVRILAVDDATEIHAFGPAIHIGGAVLHQRGGNRVPGEVREKWRHETEIGDRGMSAQQVGPVLEVNVEGVEQFLVGGLERR